MSDLVKRLRNLYLSNGTNYVQAAADRIEELARELAKEQQLGEEYERLCQKKDAENAALEKSRKTLENLLREEDLECQRAINAADHLRADIAELKAENAALEVEKNYLQERLNYAHAEEKTMMAENAALKKKLDDYRAVVRYRSVSCSQCGRDFGPGHHGFSSCEEHTERPISPIDAAIDAEIKP